MNAQRFDQILQRRTELIHKILASKGKEYSSNSDRLHNFKVAAQMDTKNETPERALIGMLKKHLVSVFDIVDSIEAGIVPSQELCDEKFGDLTNYVILLEAIVTERRDNGIN